MANELLDFVMGLVRDPAAAAATAADPAKALADARLAGVTSADVDNLIPMVSDSVSMSTPVFGPGSAIGPGGSTDAVGNVWSSGAAQAAFDAFDAAVPAADRSPGIDLPVVHDPAGGVIDAAATIHEVGPDFAAGPVAGVFEQFETVEPVLSDPMIEDAGDPSFGIGPDWSHPADDPGHVDPGHPGFDPFQ